MLKTNMVCQSICTPKVYQSQIKVDRNIRNNRHILQAKIILKAKMVIIKMDGGLSLIFIVKYILYLTMNRLKKLKQVLPGVITTVLPL